MFVVEKYWDNNEWGYVILLFLVINILLFCLNWLVLLFLILIFRWLLWIKIFEVCKFNSLLILKRLLNFKINSNVVCRLLRLLFLWVNFIYMWCIILGVMGFFLLIGLLNICLLVCIKLWFSVVLIGFFCVLWGMRLWIYFNV